MEVDSSLFERLIGEVIHSSFYEGYLGFFQRDGLLYAMYVQWINKIFQLFLFF